MLDRFLALASKKMNDVKKIAVATLVLASKMHGRTLNAKRLVAPGEATFSAADVTGTEFVICKALGWNLTPVTPYEIMKHLMLWSAADGVIFRNLLLHAQLFIDYVLCEYAAMDHLPAAVAMSSLLHAHKLAKHSPKQWLTAIKEISLFPTTDEKVHACCYAMDHVYTSNNLGIPPKPTSGQDSPTSVTRFLPMTETEAKRETESPALASQTIEILVTTCRKRKSPTTSHRDATRVVKACRKRNSPTTAQSSWMWQK
jgi:hypothetical protein